MCSKQCVQAVIVMRTKYTLVLILLLSIASSVFVAGADSLQEQRRGNGEASTQTIADADQVLSEQGSEDAQMTADVSEVVTEAETTLDALTEGMQDLLADEQEVAADTDSRATMPRSETELVDVPEEKLTIVEGPPDGKGEGTDEAIDEGNSLSFPALWAEGVSLALKGEMGAPVFNGTFVDLNGTIWYLQGVANNSWQAANAIPAEPVDVSWVDWGDNLEAKAWNEHSVVRVETVLYQDLNESMDAYSMKQISGQGTDEVWGTNGVVYESMQATVYSACARLLIQKLDKERNATDLDIEWNSVQMQWTGDVQPPLVSSAVWEVLDGSESPAAYSAEINVQGKVIYGYNWFVQDMADAAGDYRLTFVIDGEHCPHEVNTVFDTTQILASEEESSSDTLLQAAAEESGGEPDMGGGIPSISTQHDLSYIDVRIASGSGGGSGGGGHGGGTPGSGHNHDELYLPYIESLEERAVQDTQGYSVYLAQGWNSFKLPWFMLTGTQQVAKLDTQNSSVESVMQSVAGNYSYLAYYDGTHWQTYIPGNAEASTFHSFPTAPTTQDVTYYVYMQSGARMQINLGGE